MALGAVGASVANLEQVIEAAILGRKALLKVPKRWAFCPCHAAYVLLLFTCVKGIYAIYSVDWRSLTFTGERHELELRVPAPDSMYVVKRMCDGLEDAEFSIPGVIVADIALTGPPVPAPDGSTTIRIEALTVAAD